MKPKTREELAQDVHDLRAYQEAFWAMQAGKKPVKVQQGSRAVHVLAVDRRAGGVLLFEDGGSSTVRWASDVLPGWERGSDPYWRAIAAHVRRMQKAAAEGVRP